MSNQQQQLGWIGLGNMGYPMAMNLEKAGFVLSVYNRSKEKAAGFAATVAENIPALVAASDIVFTMLTNDAAVKAVYDEIATLPVKGKLFIDMSTISQSLSVAVGNTLQAAGASFIDAPVAGSTQPAKEGTLIIMAGGSADDIQRATPYLEKLGKQIVHLGRNGKGIAAKLSVNYFLSILYQGLAETVLLAEKMGVERNDLLTVINASAVGSGATKVKTPLLLADEYKPAFALDLMLKDVLLAKDEGADFPLTKAVTATYQQAANDGFGKEDVIGIINYLKKHI
ncbi:3-hydroxyisobutyrate dehydrogenase [Filimonas lacunae]|uniref:3-hydroxyisobutyrate dehydrogenase n=1 Tax=Filimonas lacunae TaxID=477680 RepID=A0A173MG71_9BACT|nr:NAD(P)-dependent oxidoreductase [Filimonas lacunae]BAV06477.1 2-hydroxy-3-oxopropionate reductase [Filimonas lacunae]SIT27102.1 3-hydroxyisobutyrate dehydrogenase [Filimonas lacunae]